MKKKLFFLSTRNLYPPYGGDKTRVKSILKVLSLNFDVHFIHLGKSSDEEQSTIKFLGDIGVKHHTVVKYSLYCLLAGLVIGFFKGLPLQVSLYYKTKLGDTLLAFYRPGDLVFTHLVRSVPHANNKFIVNGFYCEMTDTISRNYSVLKNHVIFPLKFLVALEERRLIKYEEYCVQKANHTFLVSQRDKFYLRKRTLDHKISVTPLSIESSKYEPINWKTNNEFILIIANFNSIQNFKGTKHFIENIFPTLSLKFNLKLRLVGNISDKFAKIFSKSDNVHVLGKVSSLSECLCNVICGACPIHISAGMQNKILDYMAFGLPVLSSTRSIESIDKRFSKYLYKCDNTLDYSHYLDLIINQNFISKKDLIDCSKLVKSVYSESSLERNLMSIISASSS